MDRPRHPLVIRPWKAGHTGRGKSNAKARKAETYPAAQNSRKSLALPSPRKGRPSS